jgi:UDP-glucose 4-epimerase
MISRLPMIAADALPPVLVTGGAGYIGSHAALALLDQGTKVVIVDDLSTGSQLLLPMGATFVQGRAGDRALIAAVIAREGIGAVMHFAASISVGDSVREPAEYYANNVTETLALAATCAQAGVGALVFSSTAAVYGDRPEAAGAAPLRENDILHPINPYGWSKLMGERIIADIVHAESLKSGTLSAGVLRYFNVSGADPDGRSGQNSHHPHHLIEIASHVATGLRGQFTVYGNDYPTPDGTGIRDYVHVSDIADAHVLMLRACLAEPGRMHAFNLGYGHGHSVLEVLAALGRAAGFGIPYAFGDRRAGDPAVLVADSSAAMAALDWQPRFANIDAIVAHALAWEKQRQTRLSAA